MALPSTSLVEETDATLVDGTGTNISATSSQRSGYRALNEQIRTAGLLERHPWRYALRIALTFGAYLGGWFAVFEIGDSWATLGIAVLLGLIATHVLFIGHDAGHQQISTSCRTNRFIGLFVANVLTGLSFGWWLPKHNAHHTFPNQIGKDPDIGPVDPGTTGTVASMRHGGPWSARGKLLLRVPHIFLEIGMHVTSGAALARRRDRGAIVEWILLGVHTALYLSLVFYVLSPLRAVVFIGLQQLVLGVYLRFCFAPNHKGMVLLDHNTTMGFLERQVITARNVTGKRVMSFMLGGLNYQIEHHLFPTMPRSQLLRAKRIVQPFCLEHQLDYREDKFIDSYRQAFRFLRHGQVSHVERPFLDSKI